VKKPVMIPVFGCDEQSAVLRRASYVPNPLICVDCRFGPPPGPAPANAGRVKFTTRPSLPAPSATPEVIVLPP
jgi:hypothetical protein